MTDRASDVIIDDIASSRASRAPLSPDRIVDAALAIAARAAPDGLTGRALGAELGVDRSAVWRHFVDRDALLLAVGDRLLAVALAAVPEDLAPHERMMALGRGIVAAYEAHPHVGALVACRTTQGPGEMAVVEAMLGALSEAGVPADQVPRYQRMLADTLLGYAGLRAGYACLAEDARRRDLQAWVGAYATAPAADFPEISARALDLAEVSDDDVFATLLDALWSAVRAVAATGADA